MPSGKQLSFQHGEVSPTQRFRSDEVAYSQGLAKLYNKYVRSDGGVSNRPGFRFIRYVTNQKHVPDVGEDAGIRGFTFWDAKNNRFRVLEYGDYGSPDPDYGFRIDDTTTYTTSYGNAKTGPAAWKARFTLVKDVVLMTPEQEEPIGQNHNVAVKTDGTGLDAEFGRKNPLTVGPGAQAFSTGVAPFLPVSYYITTEMKDGTEMGFAQFVTAGYTSAWDPSVLPSGAIVHPHAGLSVSFIIPLVLPYSNYSDVKSFNFYRAAGAGGLGKSFYRLAGKVPYITGESAISFADFGSEMSAITPPLDVSMYRVPGLAISGVTAAAFYQQRLFMAFKPFTTQALKPGDSIATKIGAPRQIAAPIIYHDAGSFQFTVPVTDGTPVVAWLAMERLIAFTERGTYVIRGGDNGAITPTVINPTSISSEGCSKIVEPKMSGRFGYFMNADHSKLMAIIFGDDGNMTCFEASRYSRHLLKGGIREIEVLNGPEVRVFLLRRDGKLVSITVNEENVHGFSLLETDGYIESIFRGKDYSMHLPTEEEQPLLEVEPLHDVLQCYVVRNGVRTLEYLPVRHDQDLRGELYADCAVPWGYRLIDLGDAGYANSNFHGQDMVKYVTITTDDHWNAGGNLWLHFDGAEEEPLPDSDVLHFYYEDSAGKTQVFRLNLEPLSEIEDSDLPPFSEMIPAWSDQAVPVELQNVFGKSLSTVDKNHQMSRWSPVRNRLYSNDFRGTFLAGLSDEVGFPLAISGEGQVLSSPLNPNAPTLTTEFDSDAGLYYVQLPDYFAYGYAGLPYESICETLPIEPNDGRTLTESQKIINAAGIALYETREGYVGLPDKGLTECEELILRNDTDFTQPTKNFNGHKVFGFPTEWNDKGSVAIRQVDPAPMTILSVYPKGLSGE